MSLTFSTGISQAHEGREAAFKAASQAQRQAGKSPLVMGWVIATNNYSLVQVLKGAQEALGETPLIGFSTSACLGLSGLISRGVQIAILAGEGFAAKANWWPVTGQKSQEISNQLHEALQPPAGTNASLFLVADGIHEEAIQACMAISSDPYHTAGCLAWGDPFTGRTEQLGGKNAGSAGVAAAFLSGPFRMSVGVGLGWQAVGAVTQITASQGPWIRSLNEQRPAEVFSGLFGYPARDWTFPPLNQLVRLFPFGLEVPGHKNGDSEAFLVRSPLRFEADGSLRMNSHIPEQSHANILVGSPEFCLAAAKEAAQIAMERFGPVHPSLALIFVDSAWQTMLEATPGAEVRAVQAVIGADVPIVGGYTYGQIYQPETGVPVQLLNQHFQIILLGPQS